MSEVPQKKENARIHNGAHSAVAKFVGNAFLVAGDADIYKGN